MGISKRTLNKLFSATIAWQSASTKGTLSLEKNMFDFVWLEVFPICKITYCDGGTVNLTDDYIFQGHKCDVRDYRRSQIVGFRFSI
jgi:hypothetical protein